MSSESVYTNGTDLVRSLRSTVYGAKVPAAAKALSAKQVFIPEITVKPQPAVVPPTQIETAASSVAASVLDVGVSPVVAEPEVKRKAKSLERGTGTRRYVAAFFLLIAAGLAGIFYGNQSFAPEMYADGGMAPAAEAHAQGLNYAVFDLNINIRALREEQLKRMTKAPDVVIIGASQWQEAHKELLKGVDFYNSHIHRDYWEDFPGMVELLTKYDRLPKKLIVAIRDRQFKPVSARQDWLWEPGIPNYRAMTKRIGLETESYWKTLPYHRIQALFSLPMLFENVTRWYNASVHPGPTSAARSETMDTLLSDGSIEWAAYKKKNLFTRERTLREVGKFLDANLNDPPLVDPKGVEAFVAVLDFLKSKGVQVYLVNPPFNPDFFDNIKGTPYASGLARIQSLVKTIATEHHLPVIGSFNPHEVGCTAEMYIDAEHSSPACLQKIFDQFLKTEPPKEQS